ncbi:MAG: hypothetical protein D6756_03635, partial [Cyanobacteria bacterium J083]
EPIEQNGDKFCFCTLALGKRYRLLALQLAQDLEKHSPNTKLLVLTDSLKDFHTSKNIIAIKHQQKLWCDNDKSYLIEKALSVFDYCICIDADMRILAPVSSELEWLPGITARSCCNLLKHHSRKRQKELKIIKKIANKLDININDEDLKWIHEFLFVVKPDSGKEIEFIQLFRKISCYLELNGIHIGAGTAMGLAAAKVGLPVRHDPVDRIIFFKDRIERQRIKNGQVDPQEKLRYFEKQQKLEFPQYSRGEKILIKASKHIKDLRRLIDLKINALGDFNFYYR